MEGPESPADDTEAIQPNPFENAKPGDRFYAVSNAPREYEMIVWYKLEEDDRVFSLRTKQGDFADIDLQFEQGDTLEILEEASSIEGFSGPTIKVRYKKGGSTEFCDYLVESEVVESLGKVEWKKDRRGEGNLMSPERAEQLVTDFGPTRSTDKVSDGVMLGAEAMRLRTMTALVGKLR